MVPATPAAMQATATWCSARPRGFAAEIDLAAVAAGNGGFVIQWPGRGRSVRLFGVLGRRHQRRRLRRPDHRGRCRWPRQHARDAGEATWCSARPRGFAAEIDLAAVAAGNGGFIIHGAGCGRSLRQFGVLGRRRQRRRHRRPDRRRIRRDGRQRHRLRATGYVVFGQAPGFAAEIDLGDARGRQRRLRDPGRRTADDYCRLFGFLGRRHQRRRLRRPDRRRLCGDGPATQALCRRRAMWCSARPSGFAAEVDLAAIDGRQRRLQHPGRRTRRSAGISVSAAGDVNGDGFDDLIVGASDADGPATQATMPATSYVVFGQAGGLSRRASTSPPSTPARGLQHPGRDGRRPLAASRFRRRATSTATASTT